MITDLYNILGLWVGGILNINVKLMITCVTSQYHFSHFGQYHINDS